MLDPRTIAERLLRWWRATGGASAIDDPARWLDDPLAHPDLARMTPTQLADLPFDRPAAACRPVRSGTEDRSRPVEERQAKRSERLGRESRFARVPAPR
jgi:hypothetical protein